MTRAVWVGAPLLAVLAAGAFLSAQPAAPATPPPFTWLDCTFTIAATGAWDSAGAHVLVLDDAPVQFRIGNIDRARSSAGLMLGASVKPLLMVSNPATLTFIEPPDGGETAITSVVVSKGALKFPASYSRTVYYAYSGPGFTSTPQANQHYGYCVPGRT